MILSRRHFLQSTLLAGGACAMGLPAMSRAKPESALRLTILHTNDVHSHLEPVEGGTHAGLGGAPARSAFINRVRAERANVLLLDGGDTIQGTPYFNLYGGEAEMAAMSHARYDAATIGNHEFDNGIAELGRLMRDHAEFPFVCCNYGVDDTPLHGLVRESLVIEKEGLRIGITGVGIRLEGLAAPEAYGDLVYKDAVAEAGRVATLLREEEKCDFIICLSHINLMTRGEFGLPGDRDIIRDVPEIDLVIGGHNHFFLERPEVRFRGPGTPMGYIAQAGWAGSHVGMLEFDIYGRRERELSSGGLCPLRATA